MNINELKARYQEIETEMQNPDIFADAQKLKTLGKEYNELREKISLMEKLEKLENDLLQAEETLKSALDDELKQLAEEEAASVKSQMSHVKRYLNELMRPQDPLDKRDIIIEIRAAAGGDESAIFAAELFRLYSRYAERR